jgi:hypothetical protein
MPCPDTGEVIVLEDDWKNIDPVSFASNDGITLTVQTPLDLTGKIPPYARFRANQNGLIRYMLITGVTPTTLTFDLTHDYATGQILEDAPITQAAYSTAFVPYQYPIIYASQTPGYAALLATVAGLQSQVTALQTFETTGWQDAGDTWTYATWDTASKSGTFTVTGDVTVKYHPGTRVRLTQTTVKYFIVTASTFASGTTTVTVYGGVDFTLANAAITAPSFSYEKTPQGLNVSPKKWLNTVADTTLRLKGSPSSTGWYQLAASGVFTPDLVLGPGDWRINFFGSLKSVSRGTSQLTLALSETVPSLGGTPSDDLLVATVYTNPNDFIDISDAELSDSAGAWLHRERSSVVLTTITTYHLIAQSTFTGTAGDFSILGSTVTTSLQGICNYL